MGALHEPLWGNVGAELNRMRDNPAYGPDFSEIGFWGGERPLFGAAKEYFDDLQGKRKANTETNVANIGAGTSQNQMLANLWAKMFGDIPLAQQQMLSHEQIAKLKNELEMMRFMTGERTKLGVAGIDAEAKKEAARTSAEGRIQAASQRPPTVREAPQSFVDKRAMEIKQEWDKQPGNKDKPLQQSVAELAARDEYERQRLGSKMELKANPPTPGAPGQLPNIGTSQARFAGNEDISPDMLQDDPTTQLMSLMGVNAPQKNTRADAEAAMMERFPIPSANELYQEWGATKGRPATPLPANASLPSEMTQRMYARPDYLKNAGQGGAVINDPRATAREQSLKNLNDPNFGQLPQPQSRFSQQNPEAFAELLRSQGYFVKDDDIPVGPTTRKMEQTSEDVLRAPNTLESIHGAMGKVYGHPETQSLADILPLIMGGVAAGGKALAGMGKQAAQRGGQLLLNQGSWASQEPLQLPSGARPQLPSGMGRPLPSGGPQGQITPNPWEMPSGRPMGELPPGGNGNLPMPQAAPPWTRTAPTPPNFDTGGLRPMGPAPQAQPPQLPAGLSSKGGYPMDTWALLKRLYDLRTTGVY